MKNMVEISLEKAITSQNTVISNIQTEYNNKSAEVKKLETIAQNKVFWYFSGLTTSNIVE